MKYCRCVAGSDENETDENSDEDDLDNAHNMAEHETEV